jgi:hypothetical protein
LRNSSPYNNNNNNNNNNAPLFFAWVVGFLGFSQLMWVVKLCFCPIAFVGYVHDEEREKDCIHVRIWDGIEFWLVLGTNLWMKTEDLAGCNLEAGGMH